MPEPPDFNAATMFGWIERQVGFGPRRPGSPAGHANEDFLADELRRFGLEEVRKEAIPITHWQADAAALEVSDGSGWRAIDAFPIAYTAFTPPEGIEAPLVFADRRALVHRGDWRGAIVVAEIGFPHINPALLLRFSLGWYDPDGTLGQVDHPATWVRLGWHLYRLAARKGAAGFVGILTDQPGGGCRMFAPYGFREQDRLLDKPLPGVWVDRRERTALRLLACSGRGRARLMVRGSSRPGVTHNVVGEIPGRSDEAIVLSCHHDSPFDSPVEDASGVAVVLALAEHFAARRDLARRLVVVFTAGHFYGSIGTRMFLHAHRDDVVMRTALEVSIEHIAREAVEDGSGRLVPSGRPEAAAVFLPIHPALASAVLDGMAAHDVRRVVLLPAEGPLGDYPPTDGGDWYAAGVPVINYICNPVYLLTADDAFDWVDRERLPRVAAAFAAILRAVDGLPRSALRALAPRRRRYLMKALMHLARARTTFFGLRPVH